MIFFIALVAFISSLASTHPPSASVTPTPIVSEESQNIEATISVPTPTVTETVDPTPTTTTQPTVLPTSTTAPAPSATPTRKPIPTSAPLVLPTSRPTARPTTKPVVIATPQPVTDGYTCDCSKTCPNLNCAEAQYQLNTCGCSQRDADDDGTACDADCQ